MNWRDAYNICKISGKRLPSIEEFNSLWNTGGNGLTFLSNFYWSDNFYPPSGAWVFVSGISFISNEYTTRLVRCVG